ncbi:MAG: VOC family protein [Myxococcota bacterium]
MATARLIEPDPPHTRPSRLSHLVLQSRHFAESVAWYKMVLRAKPMFENKVVCFLSYDEEHHRVMIANSPGLAPRDPKAAGVVHFAFAMETLDDLVNAYVRLREAGIVPETSVNHGFTTSLYYRDPDQNEVELAVDNFETREEMDAWFATGAFDRNFFGFRFDPELMAKRHHEGATDREILEETYR